MFKLSPFIVSELYNNVIFLSQKWKEAEGLPGGGLIFKVEQFARFTLNLIPTSIQFIYKFDFILICALHPEVEQVVHGTPLLPVSAPQKIAQATRPESILYKSRNFMFKVLS